MKVKDSINILECCIWVLQWRRDVLSRTDDTSLLVAGDGPSDVSKRSAVANRHNGSHVNVPTRVHSAIGEQWVYEHMEYNEYTTHSAWFKVVWRWGGLTSLRHREPPSLKVGLQRKLICEGDNERRIRIQGEADCCSSACIRLYNWSNTIQMWNTDTHYVNCKKKIINIIINF